MGFEGIADLNMWEFTPSVEVDLGIHGPYLDKNSIHVLVRLIGDG